MTDSISAITFFAEYHGHRISDLKGVHHAMRRLGKTRFIYFIGDSSLDNKHWLYMGGNKLSDKLTNEQFTAPACNGFEKVLHPPRMVKDVAYWLNWELSRNKKASSVCINASIEESALGERDNGVLLDQDIFVRDHIEKNDVLVVSVGGNDIALKPTICTALNMACLTFCSCTCCVEHLSCGLPLPCCCSPAFPPGLGHFLNLFKCKVENYVRRVIAKKQPKLVIVCMIYYLDEKPGGSWADRVLELLGYNRNPKKLQTIIRKVFELATSRIKIPGTEVRAFPLFQVLDGKETKDYDNRVEPSVQGGAKMGRAFYKCIFDLEDEKAGAPIDGQPGVGNKDSKRNEKYGSTDEALIG